MEKESKEPKSGKPGALSTPEMNYIKDHASTQTVEEIAVAISKTPETVRKYMFRKNLISKETLENVPDAHRRAKIKDILRSREYWTEIKQQFTPSELKMFEEHFVSLYVQFEEDCLPSEELQLKKYITLEILKDRMLRQDYSNTVEIENLKKMLDAEYAMAPGEKNPENIKAFSHNIEKLQTNQLTFLKEYRAITDEQKDAEKKLKMSRDDRIKNIQDATQNWTLILKLIHEDSVVRDKVGRQVEIHKIAAQVQTDKLFELHTYVNKDVDFPLLSHESIERNADTDEN